jgi:hypothetical protein
MWKSNVRKRVSYGAEQMPFIRPEIHEVCTRVVQPPLARVAFGTGNVKLHIFCKVLCHGTTIMLAPP